MRRVMVDNADSVSGIAHCPGKLKSLFSSAALIGLMVGVQAAIPAAAQQTASLASVEEVVVSGTRLDNQQEVPTPTMVLDPKILSEGARPNVFAALNDMPQFRGSAAPQVGASLFAGTGNWAPDLRGLGTPRTLTLIDGKRVVTGYDNADYSVIPSILIKRVDVVTGSASAAWGSNAVAGVVNIVVDDEIEGLHAKAGTGIASRGGSMEQRFELAGGTSFLDGALHAQFGAEYIDTGRSSPRASRANVGRWQVVTNPNTAPGQLPLIRQGDVGFSDRSLGGLIMTGVNAGKSFNPDGTLSTLNLGRVVGNLSIGAGAVANDDFIMLQAPSTRYNLVGRAIYQLNPDIKLTADVRHSHVFDEFPLFIDSNAGNITVSRDNAFLPAAVRTQMLAAGQTSFTMGRFNSDYALIEVDYSRRTTQASLTLDANLSDSWRLNAYYSHGQFSEDPNYRNERIVPNFNRAADSIISPTTGQPICRVALTDPSTNCVPINLFGFGAPSQTARGYVLGTSIQRTDVYLDSGAITLHGDLGDLWAGPASVAIGIEARREAINQTAGALDRASAFGFFNASAYRGDNTTKEAFSEVLIPLVRDLPLLQSLKFNGAIRVTDDKTGTIWSWKVGATDQVFDDFSVRFTHSRDIRAPNLGELYKPLFGPGIGPVFDPQKNLTYSIGSFSGGNANLKPEASMTTTAGFTYTPDFGLVLSVDYFDINIENAIGTISSQQAVTLCAAGNQTLCSTIARDANGFITTVSANSINFTAYKTSGIDATFQYTLPLELPGALSVRSTLTYLNNFTTNNGLATVEYVESQGDIRASLGAPRAIINTTLTYDTDDYGGYLRGRFLSAGYYDRTRQIQNNAIPAFFYVDAGVHVNIGIGLENPVQLNATVVNLLDRDPPMESQFSPFYDIIGRYFRVGVAYNL